MRVALACYIDEICGEYGDVTWDETIERHKY